MFLILPLTLDFDLVLRLGLCCEENVVSGYVKVLEMEMMTGMERRKGMESIPFISCRGVVRLL
jgi:hypothetical protein